jgi:hypothetical protein
MPSPLQSVITPRVWIAWWIRTAGFTAVCTGYGTLKVYVVHNLDLGLNLLWVSQGFCVTGNSSGQTVCPDNEFPPPDVAGPLGWHKSQCPGTQVPGYFALLGLLLYLVFFAPGMGFVQLVFVLRFLAEPHCLHLLLFLCCAPQTHAVDSELGDISVTSAICGNRRDDSSKLDRKLDRVVFLPQPPGGNLPVWCFLVLRWYIPPGLRVLRGCYA